MRLVLFNLMLVLMLVVPGQTLALCGLTSACACAHDDGAHGEDEEAHGDAGEPCCPRMQARKARAEDRELTGAEAPSSGCCCSADRDAPPTTVEPTLPRFELPDRDDASSLAVALPLAPLRLERAGPAAPLRMAASRAPPRAPPLRPGPALHVLHCVWRS